VGLHKLLPFKGRLHSILNQFFPTNLSVGRVITGGFYG
jgi:hypothetical protein